MDTLNKILSNQKNLKYSLLGLIILSLFAPSSAHALFGVGDFGLFDVFTSILDGLGERTGPMFASILTIFIFYLGGLFALLTSTNLLESFVAQQGQWMQNLGPMTEAGWNFTVGLSNMLLILIFIVIAFGFILKIEKIQAKKALPRLIMVAVLLNFSWVFVKMLVDISHVIYNTVLPGQSLFWSAMDVFFTSSGVFVSNFVIWGATQAAAWAVPIGNSFLQTVFAITFSAVFLPNIVTWALQAFFFYALSLMFFTFAFLFAARVFIIQILAILSPLAFLSLILDQTKSFWKQWFNTLLEWLLLGIYFLFFLNLGFGALGVLAPKELASYNIPGIMFGNITGTLVYYFAIFIYMAVLLWVGKTFIPKSADALIKFATGMAGTVAKTGLGPLGRGLRGELENAANKQKAFEKRREAGLPIERTGGLWMGEERTAGIAKWFRKRTEQGFRLAGTSLDQRNISKTKKAEEEVKKIHDPGMLRDKIKNALDSGDMNRALGLVTAGITAGKGFKKILQGEGSLRENDILSLGSFAQSINRKDLAETLGRGYGGYDNIIKDDTTLGKMIGMKNDDKTKWKSAMAYLFHESKDNDLKQFKEGAWKDSEKKVFREDVARVLKGNQIGKLATEFDSFADDYNKFTHDGIHDADWFIENGRSDTALWLSSTPAQAIETGLLPVLRGENKDTFKNKMDRQRRKAQTVQGQEKPNTEPEQTVVKNQLSERIKNLQRFGTWYQALKKNPNRSEKQNLEYEDYLRRLEETAKESEKSGEEITPEMKKNILGLNTDESLANFISKERAEFLNNLKKKGQK
ncbi:MAG: hypothetical protein WC302_00505 [Candidatus Paceibacterota bacterium]|jgi:hypothetical protein